MHLSTGSPADVCGVHAIGQARTGCENHVRARSQSHAHSALSLCCVRGPCAATNPMEQRPLAALAESPGLLYATKGDAFARHPQQAGGRVALQRAAPDVAINCQPICSLCCARGRLLASLPSPSFSITHTCSRCLTVVADKQPARTQHLHPTNTNTVTMKYQLIALPALAASVAAQDL